jgi:hypothetical protein
MGQGAQLSETDLFVDETRILRHLIGLLLADPNEQPPDQILPPDRQAAAKAAYFLLHVDAATDVDSFVVHTLDRLLLQLSHHTQQVPVQQRERVRGRINWPATYKARFEQDYDPARFVCHEVRHQYDTPENQLLKYLLDRIERSLDDVPERLRNGACYFPADLDRPPVRVAVWVERLRTTLLQLRRNIRLRGVTLPPVVDEAHLRRANLSRVEEYASVAQLYERYAAIAAAPSLAILIPLGRRVLIVPDRLDDEGETWLRFGAALFRQPPAKETT